MKKSLNTAPGANATDQTWDPAMANIDIWQPCASCLLGNEDLCACPGCTGGGDCLCCAKLARDDADNDIGGPLQLDESSAMTNGPIGGGITLYGNLMFKARRDLIQKSLDAAKEITCSFIDIAVSKGWLGGTSQSDLDDSDFLWISDAYKSGKTDNKSAGRKLPVAVHGKVSVDGWMAAWGALHGSRGGADFSGGPSKESCLAKLMNRKPSGIEIKDGEAHRVAKSFAMPSDYLQVNMSSFIAIEKADPKLGIIFGKASIASVPDREGDCITHEELEKAAFSFMSKSNKRATNTHREDIPGQWVASWVDDDGVWRVGFAPTDKKIAKAAANGDYVGFSISGTAIRIPIS